MPFRCASGTFTKNEEPSLDELLAEPIIRMMMARDGIEESDLRRLAEEALARVGSAGRSVPFSRAFLGR